MTVTNRFIAGGPRRARREGESFWWVGADSRTGRSFYFAAGYGGQFIVNVPSANATIAATTEWSGVAEAGPNYSLVLRKIVETILPGLA